MMTQTGSVATRMIFRFCAALLLLGLGMLPGRSQAACYFIQGDTARVQFPATDILMRPGLKPGDVIWTSAPVTPAPISTLKCGSRTNSGLVATKAAPTGSDNSLFPTGIPGVSYRILHPDTTKKLPTYPNEILTKGDYQFSVQSSLQLVLTGPLPPTGSMLSGALGQWDVDMCRVWILGCFSTGRAAVQSYSTGVIQLITPSCTLGTDGANKNVLLPNVFARELTGPGSTAGTTAFTINLTDCPANLRVSMTLDTENPMTGVRGVIAPKTGDYARGVGVQVLRADGSTPVDFGTTFVSGTTTGSHYAIKLQARYYQTASQISAGPVRATATYTLTYQ